MDPRDEIVSSIRDTIASFEALLETLEEQRKDVAPPVVPDFWTVLQELVQHYHAGRLRATAPEHEIPILKAIQNARVVLLATRGKEVFLRPK
jgi:hypothetical protein